MPKLTQTRLKELLSYDAVTGQFRWLVRAAHRLQVGDIAGCPEDKYWRIRIENELHRAHRLAWLYVYGVWPKADLDHINGDQRDNRITNLRDVPRSMNAQNIRNGSRKNRHGLLGVSSSTSKRNPFKSEIFVGGRKVHLGVFPTAEEAHVAHVAAKRKWHLGNTL